MFPFVILTNLWSYHLPLTEEHWQPLVEYNQQASDAGDFSPSLGMRFSLFPRHKYYSLYFCQYFPNILPLCLNCVGFLGVLDFSFLLQVPAPEVFVFLTLRKSSLHLLFAWVMSRILTGGLLWDEPFYYSYVNLSHNPPNLIINLYLL